MDTKSKILDIAMNLNRIGNWAADDYFAKKKRILTFLNETSILVNSINSSMLNQSFNKTFKKFLYEYMKLEKTGKYGPIDTLEWAENMMTWGNILTHRAKLITS